MFEQIDRTTLTDNPMAYVFREYEDGSPRTVFSESLAVARTSSWRNNLVENRVRPIDLIMGSTASPKQFLYQEQAGWMESPNHGWSNGYRNMTADDLRQGRLYTEYGSMPPFDWPLKIRMKMEDLQVNLGTTIAEYRQSADLFNAFALSMRDAAYRIRKIRKFKRRPVSEIGGHYLGFSFGLKPTVGELAAAVASLNDRLTKPIWRHVTVRDTGSHSGIDETDGYNTKYKWIYSRKAKCYYLTTPSHEGVVFGSPAEWAWELTPFSFVLDWGWNIGDALGALDALHGVTNIKLTYSEKVLYEHNKIAPAYANTIVPNIVRKKSHFRELHNTVPLPKMISWDPSKSYHTIANGMALLAALSGKKYIPRARHASL